MKIMRPTATEVRARRVTAAAPRSFALPIRESWSVVIRSARASTALFSASAEITRPIQMTMAHHSKAEMWNKNPAAIATKAATQWIRALCS